jgi:hypothetical protein
MKKTYFCLVLLSFLLQSCSFAPFSNTYSARSIGKNKWSFHGGLTGNTAIPYGRVGYGLGKNFDLGVVAEEQFGNTVAGIWGKYALVNEKYGLSFSVEASGGGSRKSTYVYLGPVIGYKFDWWEPYLVARYNYVYYQESVHLDFDAFGEYDFHNHGDLSYALVTLGNTFWVDKRIGLNLHANYAGGDLEDVFFGAGVVVTF